jgi:hypothetical protein
MLIYKFSLSKQGEYFWLDISKGRLQMHLSDICFITFWIAGVLKAGLVF